MHKINMPNTKIPYYSSVFERALRSENKDLTLMTLILTGTKEIPLDQ